MHRLRCLLFLVLALADAALLPSQAKARGFYCSSYDIVEPKYGGMVCRTTCVYCVDTDRNNELVSESCYDNSCWFGGRPAM